MSPKDHVNVTPEEALKATAQARGVSAPREPGLARTVETVLCALEDVRSDFRVSVTLGRDECDALLRFIWDTKREAGVHRAHVNRLIARYERDVQQKVDAMRAEVLANIEHGKELLRRLK